jgi:catechol-2,3-dioxygenase
VREQALAAGREVRGIVDHGFIHSIYLRDPNGYVIELTAKREGSEREMERAKKDARRTLDEWQSSKTKRAA